VDHNLVPVVVEASVGCTLGLGSEEQEAEAYLKPRSFHQATSHASSLILYYEITSSLLESWRSGAQKGRVLRKDT
jgi:hypothetical protein